MHACMRQGTGDLMQARLHAVGGRAGPGRGGGAGIGVTAPEFIAGLGVVYSVPSKDLG